MLLALVAANTIDFDAEVRRAVGTELRQDGCRDGVASSERIIICGARKRPNRYRLAAVTGPRRAVESGESGPRPVDWNSVGATGTGSCSAVGPGGFTGCLMKGINSWGSGRGGWRF